MWAIAYRGLAEPHYLGRDGEARPTLDGAQTFRSETAAARFLARERAACQAAWQTHGAVLAPMRVEVVI